MRQTVVGVFDQYAAAQQAARTLQTTGFADSVFISEAMAGPPSGSAALTDSGMSHGDDGVMAHLRSFFVELFGAEESHPAPSPTVRPGGALVRVEVDQGRDLDTVRQTLQSAGAVGIEEHEEPASPSHRRDTSTASTRPGPTPPPRGMQAAELPVLHDPLDDAARAFARPSARPATQATSSPHQMTRPRDLGAERADTIDALQPAYRYGQALRADPRHAGRTWEELEPHARSDWERQYPGSTWERFKVAVRQGWELAIHA
jgi:hypothetical protein